MACFIQPRFGINTAMQITRVATAEPLVLLAFLAKVIRTESGQMRDRLRAVELLAKNVRLERAREV